MYLKVVVTCHIQPSNTPLQDNPWACGLISWAPNFNHVQPSPKCSQNGSYSHRAICNCFGMSWVLTRHHFIHVHRFSYHVLICCSSIVPPEAFQPSAAVRSDSSFAPCVAWPRAVARWQSTLHVRSSDREKRLTTADWSLLQINVLCLHFTI